MYTDIQKLISDSDGHLKLVVNEHQRKRLTIIFGPLGYHGSKFFLEKQLDILEENVLFVNSCKNDWFVEGLCYFKNSTTVEESAKILHNIIDRICQEYLLEEIIVIGYSMGAYGALIYSSLMSFDIPQRIILLGPKVNLYSSRVKKHYQVFDNNEYKELYALPSRISKLWDVKHKKYTIIYGELDLLDVESILFYQNSFRTHLSINYEIISIAATDHEIFRYFKSKNMLLEMIKGMILDRNDILKTGELHKKLVISDLTKLRKSINNQSRINQLLVLLNKYPLFVRALFELGMHYRNDNPKLALQYFKRAVAVAPEHVDINYALYEMSILQNHFSDAMVYIGICIKNCNPNNRNVYESELKKVTSGHFLDNKSQRPSFTKVLRILWEDVKNNKEKYPTFILDSKLIAYEFAHALGLQTPKIYQTDVSVNEIQFIPNSVIKPMYEDSSKGVMILHGDDNFKCLHSGRSFKGISRAYQYAKDLLKIKRVRIDKWMVEELIFGESLAADIKFYCFYGQIGLILETQRIPSVKRCWYDSNLNVVQTGKYDDNNFIGNQQSILKKLSDIACRISMEIPAPFVRIDFLQQGENLYLGEFTPIPGGYQYFNRQWDTRLGEMYQRAMTRFTIDVAQGKIFEKYMRLDTSSIISHNLARTE